MAKIIGFRLTAIVFLLMAMVLPAMGEVAKSQANNERVATVNGLAISREEFEGEVLKAQKSLLGYGKPLSCSQVSSVSKEVLEGMIRREIIYQTGLKAGVKPDEKAVDSDIKTIRQQFLGDAEYKKELERRKISEEVLRTRLEKNSLIQQYIENNIASKITVPDSDVITYYEGNLNVFRQPQQSCVGHIFIQSDPKWDDSKKQEARRRIDQVIKDLKQGKDFAGLAREQSDGPTRANGGDLGCLRPGQMDSQFEKAIRPLKAGEVTDVIETNSGFHVFRLTDRKPETVLAYEQVKEKIRQLLRDEKARQEAEQHAKDLRQKATVEIFTSQDN